ncbi:MAG TPA: putative DNA binding domain-containing protein [Thermotogota bacterium]|nr:putative DNA binding domain-containing protein [Thermotogota bacterium]HRW93670.1 putative DNA binding domain-containing protein [Thermotogota bacterium]
MRLAELRKLVANGEDSRLQFKADISNVDSLAAEMVAFANSEGGRIVIGVRDDGQITGLAQSAVGRINQLISNAASQHVRSPISLCSGIKRALDAWPETDFMDDRDGCLFTATVHRKPIKGQTLDTSPSTASGKTSGKTSGKILAALKLNGNLTIPELASMIGITERSIERNIRKLQEQNHLRRIGPAKGGYWEVIE